MLGSHFVTFNPTTLPIEKVSGWYIPPVNADESYISGNDDSHFNLNDLKDFKIDAAIAERGYEYYAENRVLYLSLHNGKGYAIVKGTKPYEVEFYYNNGLISELVCSCFCSYNCKHEFATMLQLRETSELIEKNYSDKYKSTGYFAAINKIELFNMAVCNKENGTFTL